MAPHANRQLGGRSAHGPSQTKRPSNSRFQTPHGVEAAEGVICREQYRRECKQESTINCAQRPRTNENRAALPALLAVAAAWKEMVRAGAYDIPLLVETGQVIETHHIAMLIAAGASAVFPYLAMEFAENLKPGGARKLSRSRRSRSAQSPRPHGHLHRRQLSQ